MQIDKEMCESWNFDCKLKYSWKLENLKVAMQTFKKFDEKIDWKIDQNRQKSIFNNFGWFWSSQNWQKLSLVDF